MGNSYTVIFIHIYNSSIANNYINNRIWVDTMREDKMGVGKMGTMVSTLTGSRWNGHIRNREQMKTCLDKMGT